MFPPLYHGAFDRRRDQLRGQCTSERAAVHWFTPQIPTAAGPGWSWPKQRARNLIQVLLHGCQGPKCLCYCSCLPGSTLAGS